MSLALEAIETFGINVKDLNGCYRKGDLLSRDILVHVEKRNPLNKDFSIHPEDYSENLPGITFYTRCTTEEELKILHEQVYKELEERYSTHLEKIPFSFFTSLTGYYYYMELKNDVTVVFGDVMYNRLDNKYVTVSFFKGVEKENLTTFLENIY